VGVLAFEHEFPQVLADQDLELLVHKVQQILVFLVHNRDGLAQQPAVHVGCLLDLVAGLFVLVVHYQVHFRFKLRPLQEFVNPNVDLVR